MPTVTCCRATCGLKSSEENTLPNVYMKDTSQECAEQMTFCTKMGFHENLK